MKILAITSQKGGVGKTTLATSLAVAAWQDGREVVIYDLDPQASACFWSDRRQQELGPEGKAPFVMDVQTSRLAAYIERARDGGAELVILDCPPVHRDIAHDASNMADFVLVPTKPEIFSIRAMQQTVQAVQQIGKPLAVVLIDCPPSGPEVDQALAVATKQGATITPVVLHHLKAFPRAQIQGLSPQEAEPDSKAAAEVRELYQFTVRQLFGEQKHGKKGQSRKRA